MLPGGGICEDGGARELAFWVGTPFDQNKATVGNGSMVAFRASTWKEVDDFHTAALANGGQSEGAAGPPATPCSRLLCRLCARPRGEQDRRAV